ncbi:hypothetical protein ES705_39421 [subsurface metagenome]
MKRIIKFPRWLTGNLIGAYEQYLQETGRKDVRLGTFLGWLQGKTIKNKGTKIEAKRQIS